MGGCAILVCLVLLRAIVAMVWRPGTGGTEHFSIAERDGVLCYPFLNNREAWLMPNSIVFVIQGYNYATTPVIIRDRKEIVPLQYAWDYRSMAYYFVVSAPRGLEGSEWILQTSDFVEPIVNEGRTGARLNVGLLRRRDQYNWWSISA